MDYGPPASSGRSPARPWPTIIPVISLFTPAELDTLAGLNERILRHLAQDDDSRAEDQPS